MGSVARLQYIFSCSRRREAQRGPRAAGAAGRAAARAALRAAVGRRPRAHRPRRVGGAALPAARARARPAALARPLAQRRHREGHALRHHQAGQVRAMCTLVRQLTLTVLTFIVLAGVHLLTGQHNKAPSHYPSCQHSLFNFQTILVTCY